MQLPAVPVETEALPLPSSGKIYQLPVVMNEALCLAAGSKVEDAAKQLHDERRG
jgi:hypothetical protein